MSEIARLRAGKEMLRYNSLFHCLLWRRGHGAICLAPFWNWAAYRELVTAIAEEMAALDRFDRVERGLTRLTALFYLLLFCGLGLLVAYAAVFMWSTWGPGRTAGVSLFLVVLGVAGIACGGFGLWQYLRWYRPRRVRDLDDLREVL